jgi:hypothetical protein
MCSFFLSEEFPGAPRFFFLNYKQQGKPLLW